MSKPLQLMEEEDLAANNNTVDDVEESMTSLLSKTLRGSRVLLGVNAINDDTSSTTSHNNNDFGPTYVARMATTGSNEDLYRILHACLQPLSDTFGFDFYRDRIHSSSSSSSRSRSWSSSSSTTSSNSGASSSRSTTRTSGAKRTTSQSLKNSSNNDNDESTSTAQNEMSTNRRRTTPFVGIKNWTAYMLADSGLPTGSFAHSAGLEAASQLGLFDIDDDDDDSRNRNDATTTNTSLLQTFVHASLRSMLQLQLVFVLHGMNIEHVEEWRQLDSQLHAYILSNIVSCRASQEQGRGLLRISLSWLHERHERRRRRRQEQGDKDSDDGNDDNNKLDNSIALLEEIQDLIVKGRQPGHLASIFGVVCSSLGMTKDDNDEACRLLGYCAARDMVSAAVRLNLIGPIGGVSLLDSCWDVVDEGIAKAKDTRNDDLNDDAASAAANESQSVSAPMIQASTCAPIVDTLHPCHEILSTRLFRS